MKKTLKFAIVMSIIITLLMGNASVFAASIVDIIASKNAYKIASVNNEEKENEKVTNVDESQETPENGEEGLEPKQTSMQYENSGKEVEQISSNEEEYGKLFISLDLRLPQVNQNKSENSIFSVKLKAKGGNYVGSDHLEFYKGFRDREDETKLFYTFSKVNPGAYVLEITAPGYVKFTQNITIKANTRSELSLTNGYNEDKLDVLRDEQIGVVVVGDVNGDGEVVGYDANGKTPEGKANDEAEMIHALDVHLKDSKYDLNGDGEVSIIDLTYISINKNKGYIGGTVFESADISTASVTADETTQIDETHGTVQDILENNDKYITLKPADETKEISNTNPVVISLDLGEDAKNETKEITIAPSSNPENNIEDGTIIIETVDGQTIEAKLQNSVTKSIPVAYVPSVYTLPAFSKVAYVNPVQNLKVATETKAIANAVAVIEPDGTISVDLGNKVAVKRVTIKVTATKSNKLADIAKVEFLNGNADRVPAPELNIPKITGFDVSSGESFTVTWENMQNVTGYEVRITAQTKKDGLQTDVFSVDGNSITISDFHGGVKDNIPAHYYVAVQSVNGEWRSGYSEETDVFVDAVTIPGPPDNLTLKGGVREIKASWKKMNATDSYKVFYRKYNEGDYIEATVGITLTEPAFTITGLEDNQRYQVYVIGVNVKGQSAPSDTAVVETTNIEPAMLPAYKLINTPKGEGELTSNIKNITKMPAGKMVDSPLDLDESGNPIKTSDGISAKGIADNDYNTYFFMDDWDYGATYHINEWYLKVTFNQTYKMNYFAMAQIKNLGTIDKVKVWYKDMTTGKMEGPIDAAQVVTRTGENGRQYTTIKLSDAIETDTIQFGLGRTYGYIREITIAEMRFYEYDSLEDDINNLYADQMHTTLKNDVTLKSFEELQARLNTKDEASGEYHPEKDSLQKELDLAKLIYDTEGLKDVVKIDTSVTKAKDSHITFSSGLNAWQPLGVVARSSEVIKVFVGSPDKNSGDATNLNLIATQYYPEAANWYAVAKTRLKVGMNEITIPRIDNQDKESGGSLYIEYTGNNENEIYGARVVGGETIPVLDLTKIDNNDETKRMEAVTKYVEQLEKTVQNLESAHEAHKAIGAKELNYEYNEQNCIAGATEIVLDQMMYSVSSKQILKGLGEGTVDEKSQKLYKSLVAMEDMIDLFYQHKGLNKDTTTRDKNTYPTSRLNIRYHQMFVGAAMYAGGLHIGIDWGDVPTLSQGNPIQTESVNGVDGKYVDGNYFGWGISHEIGHIINESAYVHGEVTNNYFSVLSQAQDTNESVRFQYPEVYKKVMSGKTGKAQNVFTQLGLYWQLHLAYDKGGYNFKTYDNYSKQQENLLFARMDSYARDTSLAPKAEGEKGVVLTLGKSTDDNLMRLACAAAQKNLLEFFEKWGMTPDAETKAYAEQWEKETRAIYFINDEARAYELAGKPEMTKGTTVSATREIVQVSDDNGNKTNTNKVKLTINSTNKVQGAMLGYKIVRTYMDNDVEITVPVAFVTVDGEQSGELIYVDTIETVNNRVFTYKVTGYDKYLNETAEYVLEPIKVEHDGTIGGKEDWVVTTNLTSADDTEVTDKNSEDVDVSDGVQTVKAVSELVDGNYSKNYIGKVESGNAEITIELEECKKLVGFKYTCTNGAKLGSYTASVSKDGKEWIDVKTSEVKTTSETKTVYFGEGDRLEIHDVTYIKLTIEAKQVSIAEIDLIGQTGDNVDFIKTADGNYSGYGILQETVTLGKRDVDGNTITIPAGSIVFTGTYKGNPAYNVLKLWNQDNKLITGAYQTFYADPVPKDAKLTDVSEGIWIYWLEEKIYMDAEGNQVDGPDEGTLQDNPMYKEFLNAAKGTTVRAELYRTNDAINLTGERITSDTYRIPISNPLPKIKISSNGNVE